MIMFQKNPSTVFQKMVLFGEKSPNTKSMSFDHEPQKIHKWTKQFVLAISAVAADLDPQLIEMIVSISIMMILAFL